jgi:putative DNA primase/helicase
VPETRPGVYHRTDLGNARRLTDQHGANLRHVAAWGSWLIWDTTRWLRDETSEIMRRAIATIKSMWAELADLEDRSDRDLQLRWIMRSESAQRLRAMTDLAASQPEIALVGHAFDQHGWLLNCPNGTINLRSGQLQPHRQDDLLTKRCTVAYEPSASCPRWLAFLDRIFAGNTALIAFLQRAIGYSLTADTSEQCLFILHGDGANGKSTLIETIRTILGDYAKTTPMDSLMAKSQHSIPSDIARLQSARFVSASEAGDGRKLDEELVKRISGADTMTARFLHHDWFEFTPVLKLWIAANHRPTIRGLDDGIWRRILLIPFSVKIPLEQRDSDLAHKLAAEASGILTWAIQGCLEWQKQQLSPPPEVIATTNEYRTDMDALGRFLADRCIQAPGAIISAKQLYGEYVAWTDENGEFRASQTRLGAYLRDHGLNRDRDSRGATIWRGLSLTGTPQQGDLL